MIITPMSSIRIVFDYLNPFHATDLFWYPLKTLENLWFSDVFRGLSKEISDMEWVNRCYLIRKKLQKMPKLLRYIELIG